MERINFSEQEVQQYLEKSNYRLISRPLLRLLTCKKNYENYQLSLKQGEKYLVWISQCYRPRDKQNIFYHMIAFPQIKKRDKMMIAYYTLPLDIFGDYSKEDEDMVVTIEEEKYKLIKDFNGYSRLIPYWTLDRDEIKKFIQKELGETPYVICARIMGTNIAPNDIFVGWEIMMRGGKYKTVAYFNIFESQLVKNLKTLTYVHPLGSNQKACIMGGSSIKFYKNRINIKLIKQ